MDHSDVIAWLLPSTTNQPALEAVRMSQNANLRVAAIPPSFGPSPLPSPIPEKTIDPALLSRNSSSSSLIATSRPALELSFAKPPRNHAGFVLGTDADVCDVVLPNLPGIAPRHCHITFDAERRLVVRDTSASGTAVWYDGSSAGDRAGESWVLSSGCSYAFPAMVDRVVIDVQTVRFHVVVNHHQFAQPDVYRQKVDDFVECLAGLASLAWLFDVTTTATTTTTTDDLKLDPVRGFGFGFDQLGLDLAGGDDLYLDYDENVDDDFEMHVVDEARDMPWPLPSVVPPVYVKYMFAADDGLPPDTYLWNTARPWEPMVKVTC